MGQIDSHLSRLLCKAMSYNTPFGGHADGCSGLWHCDYGVLALFGLRELQMALNDFIWVKLIHICLTSCAKLCHTISTLAVMLMAVVDYAIEIMEFWF